MNDHDQNAAYLFIDEEEGETMQSSSESWYTRRVIIIKMTIKKTQAVHKSSEGMNVTSQMKNNDE